MEKYFDKHGKLIKEGDKLQHINGDIETVVYYPHYDSKELYFDGEKSIFPLHQFDLSEWEIFGKIND